MNMLRRIPLCLYANISALLTAERMTVARTHGALRTMLEEPCWALPVSTEGLMQAHTIDSWAGAKWELTSVQRL